MAPTNLALQIYAGWSLVHHGEGGAARDCATRVREPAGDDYAPITDLVRLEGSAWREWSQILGGRMNPEMEPVVSSNVAAIGYDENAEEVYVEFLDSGLYAYGGVSLPVFREFQAASSKGSFVNQILKPGYPYRKV